MTLNILMKLFLLIPPNYVSVQVIVKAIYTGSTLQKKDKQDAKEQICTYICNVKKYYSYAIFQFKERAFTMLYSCSSIKI